jgi:hypothetical protein
VDEGQIEVARDSVDPRAEIIGLILEHRAPSRGVVGSFVASLRGSLASLTGGGERDGDMGAPLLEIGGSE